jgi:hypothetical protein
MIMVYAIRFAKKIPWLGVVLGEHSLEELRIDSKESGVDLLL